ncbi:MAG: 3-phosphoshikimate 1-carboxyvinyltransferase [Planctomycetes bacterium]|nr:3-phosphoshikimate 1-carboxyvinyltransferase [Planctomycetota bacterium]
MTNRILQPTDRPIDARLELPGSKSFANRAIVCAALRGEACTLRNISPADDTAIMLNVLADLGWRVTRPNPLSTEVRLEPPSRPVAGPHETQIYTGAAGTATRFACALLTVLPGRYVLDGNARMRQRPMGELIAALRQLGAKIEERGEPGCVPLAIEGASLRGGTCSLRGDVSSQFLSALLMVAPTRGGGVEIEIEGDLVSKPYVDMTLEVMRAFGMQVERQGYRRFRVVPGSRGAVPGTGATYTVPPDGTAASYFWGAAAVTGGKCVIDGLTRQDVQGDVQFVELLGRMGCEVLEFPNGLGVGAHGAAPLRAIHADLSALPDCAQTLAVVCAFASGTSRLTGLGTLRVKETDRIAALQTELAKLDVVTRAGPDWLEIDGVGNKSPQRQGHVSVRTYDDHRMAMSFAIAGLRAPVEINDAECVSKSFPTFWEYWDRLI